MADESSSLRKLRLSTAKLSGNALGAVFMVLSGVGFTIFMVLAKQLSADVHPIFIAFWRSLFALLLSVPLVLKNGLGLMRTSRPGMLLVRSLFGTLGFTLGLIAVSDMFTLSLSQFNAISFSRPLFVTTLAALVLGEIVGWHRWAAVGVGFIGVIVMVMPGLFYFWQPGALHLASFDMGSVAALASAFFLAFAIVLVKSLSQELSALALLTYANLLSTLLLLPFALYYWSWPDAGTWALLFVMAFTGFLAQYCYISAVSVGDASFVSPLDYLRLPMATVADLIVIGLLPGANVWFGAAIIVMSAAYIAIRERRRATI